MQLRKEILKAIGAGKWKNCEQNKATVWQSVFSPEYCSNRVKT